MSKDLLFLEDNHHKKIKEKKRTLRFKTLSEKKKKQEHLSWEILLLIARLRYIEKNLPLTTKYL